MNFDTVITKEDGIQAMHYLVNNVNNDKFVEYALNYLIRKALLTNRRLLKVYVL